MTVVQSIVSLTSLLRGQFVQYFRTLWPNTLIMFSVENRREALAMQCKSFSHFSTKNNGLFQILTFEILVKRQLMMSLVLNNRALAISYLFINQSLAKLNLQARTLTNFSKNKTLMNIMQCIQLKQRVYSLSKKSQKYLNPWDCFEIEITISKISRSFLQDKSSL